MGSQRTGPTATCTLTLEHQEDYDLFCAQQLQDPYPLFAELRKKDPVHWCEPLNTWLAFRYDDTMAALKDPRFLIRIRKQ